MSYLFSLSKNFHYFIKSFFWKSGRCLTLFVCLFVFCSFQGFLPWKQHSLAPTSSLSLESPLFTVSSVGTENQVCSFKTCPRAFGTAAFPEVNDHVRCLWEDRRAKWPDIIFMEEWFKKKLKKRQISRSNPIRFSIFEQLKEDSSAVTKWHDSRVSDVVFVNPLL